MSLQRLVTHLEAAERELRAAREAMTAPPAEDPIPIRVPLGMTLAEAELLIVKETLAAEGGNRSRTAARLGIGRRTINYWLAEERTGAAKDGGHA